MNVKPFISVLSAAAFLSGCISMAQRAPAPVSEASSQPVTPSETAQLPESEGVKIRAYEPSAPVMTQEPVHSKAVISLLQQAQAHESSGDYPRAVGAIERALRIEPRNAHLWNRLAHLRLAQKMPGLAKDMAAKSTALAGADMALKRDNWLLIAQAHRAAGDSAGARIAERNANEL